LERVALRPGAGRVEGGAELQWETEFGGEDGVGATNYRVEARYEGGWAVLTVAYFIGL
jgi:hypothetical protein